MWEPFERSVTIKKVGDSIYISFCNYLFRFLKQLIFLGKLLKVLIIMSKGVQLLQEIYLEGKKFNATRLTHLINVYC